MTHKQQAINKSNDSLEPSAAGNRLTLCGLVVPYGDKDLGQHWFSLVAWQHQAISWTNVDLSSVGFCGIHLRAISHTKNAHKLNPWQMFKDYTFKITTTSLPRVNELMQFQLIL